MKDVAFVSVCFGDGRYFFQMDRLRASILAMYPDANLVFFKGQFPPNSPDFYHSLYGFKPHAVKVAKDNGFKKVIWLDPAMILVDKIDDLLKFEMMAVKDDNPLYNVVSDACYKYFGTTAKEVFDLHWHLVGGSVYVFDFDKPAANAIFDKWLQAEKDGMFGSQEQQARGELQGHRMDEAVMALAMYQNGIEPVGMDVARYCNEGNQPIFIKRHFK